MICKHIVDRYNIYYIYTPTKINGRIHSTAVLYVHIALLMMQFQVFTFLLMRTKSSKVTLFSMIVLLVSVLVFAGHCFFHWFTNINHLTYSVSPFQIEVLFCMSFDSFSVVFIDRSPQN